MENTGQNWEIPEYLFEEWLRGEVKPSVNAETTILKSIFFFNREKIKQSISSHLAGKIDLIQELETLYSSVSEPREELIVRDEDCQDNQIMFSLSSTISDIKNKKIIDGLMANDPNAYLNLYENEFPKIYWHIRKNSGSFEQAKDVFQDALVIILEKVIQNNFDINCNFGTYLFSICKNLWFTQLKRNKRETIYPTDKFRDLDGSVEFIDPGEKPEDYEFISHAIGNLGSGCQKLLSLFYYEQQSWENIAEQLGYTSAANARNQKYKCLEKIRKIVMNQIP
jgi:RNA polymerase sigma factor (sigma-70 family)